MSDEQKLFFVITYKQVQFKYLSEFKLDYVKIYYYNIYILNLIYSHY